MNDEQKIDDGGPANPLLDDSMDHYGHAQKTWGGMSLRDWFAGQADEAWSIWLHLYAEEALPGEAELLGQVAAIRGKLADAMLDERKKPCSTPS